MLLGAALLHADFLVAELAYHLGWRTYNQRARLAGEAAFHKRSSTNDGFRCYSGVVHDHGIHSNHHIFFDHATMRHRAVAYVAVSPNDGIATGKRMHHWRHTVNPVTGHRTFLIKCLFLCISRLMSLSKTDSTQLSR